MRRALAALLASALAGAAAADSGAPIELRGDCPRDAGDRCFRDLSTLDRWLWETRRPSAADPVTVEVGPGEFRGRIACRAQGFVTFRGAGRAQSTLRGTVDEMPFATIHADGCTALRFERLTIAAPRSHTGRGKAVFWSGAGESSFRDVVLEAEYVAWYGSNCLGLAGTEPSGTHRFERALLRAGAVGVVSDCARVLLSESEIVVMATPETSLPFLGPGLEDVAAGVKAGHRSRIELLDSRVRVDTRAAASAVQTFGLLAGAAGNRHPLGGGRIEMRGGALHVAGSPSGRTSAVRAHTGGRSEGATARVRVVGATLELSPRGALRSTGDGRVEWVGALPH